jgi:hypothetical protein
VDTVVWRLAATRLAGSPSVLSLTLGRASSSSRMIRSNSANAARRSRADSNGTAPTSSSYRRTPSAYVGPGVDIAGVEFRLFRAHMLRRPNQNARFREQRPLGQMLTGRLGHSEINDFRQRLTVPHHDEHVGWLDVAMDETSLMCMFHSAANLGEELRRARVDIR